jgi:hypothetical protein
VTDVGGLSTLIELDNGQPTGAEIDADSVMQQLGLPRGQFDPNRMDWVPALDWLCLFPRFNMVGSIVCVDPDTSQVRAEIPTGLADAQFSALGLAYDPEHDLFYVAVSDGGYQTLLRTVAGPLHPRPRTSLHTCVLPYQAQWLEYNPTSQTLWTRNVMIRHHANVYRQFDPQECNVISTFRMASQIAGVLTGDDMDQAGHILIPHAGLSVSQVSTMQTGEPTADRLPWLHVSTTKGSLKPHGSQRIDIKVDWQAVPHGVRGAKLVFRGSGGANSKVTIPIRLARTHRGTSKPDRIQGTDWPDFIQGRGGNDVLLGRGGNDRIEGGGGSDAVWGGSGADQVFAGPGRDIVHLERDGVRDTIRCGPGRDRVAYHTLRDHRDVLRGCERIRVRR